MPDNGDGQDVERLEADETESSRSSLILAGTTQEEEKKGAGKPKTKQQATQNENGKLSDSLRHAGTEKLVEYEESKSELSSSEEDENDYGIEEEELEDDRYDDHDPRRDYKRR